MIYHSFLKYKYIFLIDYEEMAQQNLPLMNMECKRH